MAKLSPLRGGNELRRRNKSIDYTQRTADLSSILRNIDNAIPTPGRKRSMSVVRASWATSSAKLSVVSPKEGSIKRTNSKRVPNFGSHTAKRKQVSSIHDLCMKSNSWIKARKSYDGGHAAVVELAVQGDLQRDYEVIHFL